MNKMVAPNELRLWTWKGKRDYQDRMIIVFGTYLEAVDKALLLNPNLTKEQLDSPHLFDLTSEVMSR